jgi:hypothetical protein
MTAIQMRAEFECWPLWLTGPEEFDNVDPETLSITAGLADDLNEWAATYDGTLNQEYPPDSRFDSPEDEHRFVVRGRELARRLRAELDDSWTLRYYDTELGHDVEITR